MPTDPLMVGFRHGGWVCIFCPRHEAILEVIYALLDWIRTTYAVLHSCEGAVMEPYAQRFDSVRRLQVLSGKQDQSGKRSGA